MPNLPVVLRFNGRLDYSEKRVPPAPAAPPTTPAPVADPWRLGEASAVLMRMIGFEPTGEEQARILRCRKRFVAVAGGGQAGKSRSAAASHVIHVFEDVHRNPGKTLLYWLVAADYERVRGEWNYIIENFRRLGYEVDASKRLDPGQITIY